MVYNMLDHLPELELKRIEALMLEDDKEFIDTLLEKSIYKTREELFEVYEAFNIDYHSEFGMHEYQSI